MHRSLAQCRHRCLTQVKPSAKSDASLRRMTTFICPMHADVRESASADCPKCGMKLVPADSRFPLLAHMMGRPVHLAAMIALMLALMAAAMMLMR
jgi:hypothetical protein